MILPGREFIRWKSSAASDAVGMTNLELVLVALVVLIDRQPAIREDDLPSFHTSPCLLLMDDTTSLVRR